MYNHDYLGAFCITLQPLLVILREVAGSMRCVDCSDFASLRAAMTGGVVQRFLERFRFECLLSQLVIARSASFDAIQWLSVRAALLDCFALLAMTPYTLEPKPLWRFEHGE